MNARTIVAIGCLLFVATSIEVVLKELTETSATTQNPNGCNCITMPVEKRCQEPFFAFLPSRSLSAARGVVSAISKTVPDTFFVRHLPDDLCAKLGRYWDHLAPEENPFPETDASTRRTSAGAGPHYNTPANYDSTNPGLANDQSTHGDPTSDGRTHDGPTNNASSGEDFGAPPGRNPAVLAPPPSAKLGPANDLPPPDEANSLR